MGEKADRDLLLIGRKPVLELTRRRPGLIQSVRILRDAELSEELEKALAMLRSSGVDVLRVEREEFFRYGADGNHQGVLALLHPRRSFSLDDLISRSQQPGRSKVLVVLDQLHDPHNLGAILRVAEASGADGIVLTEARTVTVTPAVRKVSAGASELIPIATVINLSRALQQLKKAGFWVIGTVAEKGTASLFSTEIPLPSAVVFGSEGEGMRKLTKDICDVLVTIPIAGDIESLNVNQAASVLLYELFRRRQKI